MGASLVYREEPLKDIVFESNEDERVTFASGEMQGWRLNMVSHYFLILRHYKLASHSEPLRPPCPSHALAHQPLANRDERGLKASTAAVCKGLEGRCCA